MQPDLTIENTGYPAESGHALQCFVVAQLI
jgi:hypothetical protein